MRYYEIQESRKVFSRAMDFFLSDDWWDLREGSWIQGAAAKDAKGNVVDPGSADACQWSLAGACEKAAKEVLTPAEYEADWYYLFDEFKIWLARREYGAQYGPRVREYINRWNDTPETDSPPSSQYAPSVLRGSGERVDRAMRISKKDRAIFTCARDRLLDDSGWGIDKYNTNDPKHKADRDLVITGFDPLG